MASYDSERNCYVVRIVYDGPGLAGKTTNLERICQRVPTESRSEMVTPAALKGRTMFFDWLEVSGPPIHDKGLRFQLISVPGQAQRNYRRRPLVDVADVVVLVCDPTPAGIRDTQRVWAQLRVSAQSRGVDVPVVLQANKQDLDGLMSDVQLRRRLRVADSVPLVRAVAVTGKGVWETLVTAMRLGVSGIQSEDVAPLLPAFANADALFDHVLGFEDSPDDAPAAVVEEINFANDEGPGTDGASEDELMISARSMADLEARARRAASEAAAERPAGSKRAR